MDKELIRIKEQLKEAQELVAQAARVTNSDEVHQSLNYAIGLIADSRRSIRE